jgi:methyl-accepting chemotaxis protein
MAKNTIVTRITLEGAQQITGDLKNLGAAGEKALGQIKKAADAAGSGGLKFQQVFSAAKSAFNQFGGAATNFAKSIEGVGRSLETVRNRIGLITAAVGLASGAFLALNISAGKSAEELQNNASAVGLSAQEYQKFRFAAEQVGLSADQFTGAMSVLTDQMQQTKDAADPATTALGKLGIAVTDGSLRSAGDVLKDFSNTIAGMADGTDKTSAVIEVFGRRIGARLIPFLNLGSQGLANLSNEAVRLGAVVSDETLGKLAAFDDSIDKLKSTANGARLSLAAVFAPALTQGANALSELIAQNEAALQEFASFLLTTIQPVIRDVFLALTGQDDQVQLQWILDAKQQLIELGQAAQAAFVDIIIPALEAVNAVANTVATAINNVFGTDFSGKELLIAAALLSLTGIFGALISIIGAVVAAFGLLSSTVGLVVAAVVLVGLDIVLFSKLIASINWAAIGQAIYDAIAGAFERIGAAITGFVSGALAKVKGLFDDFVSYIEGTWLGKILAAVGKALAALGAAQSKSGEASNQNTGGAGFARGGPAGRPGRKGSRDTVLAWFDPREFVIRPEATAKLGANVLNFLNATGELPGFAMGGLVAAAAGTPGMILAPVSKSAHASEGPRHTLNLTLDGETFAGLGMDDQTLAALSRHVARKKLTSGGVKPSWYK